MIDELINKFLDDREQRVSHQKQIFEDNGNLNNTLVTIRVNYPGIEKSNYVTDSIADIIYNHISTYYYESIVYKETYKNMEGVIGHFIMKDNFHDVKTWMVNIEENHILGRCMDIDVYGYDAENKDLKGISRSDLGLGSRKCFICNESAKICSRSQKHDVSEIKAFFQKSYDNYLQYVHRRNRISYEVSNYVLKSMIEEVSTMPSFGLVSPVTNGSHSDMNFHMFLNSSFAITPHVMDMIKNGYSFEGSRRIFDSIRRIGIDCEEAMFEATNGVNTHKGMIFLMGVISTAAAKAFYEESGFDSIKKYIQEMCSDILKDFSNLNDKKHLTHGEKLFMNYGFKGIRGEVENGLSILFDDVLPYTKELQLKENKLYGQILLKLMSIVDDSTIVHRQGIDELKKVKQKSSEILCKGGFNTEEGINAAMEFEKQCIMDNISPGGSADLLAAVIFLIYIEPLFKGVKA